MLLRFITRARKLNKLNIIFYLDTFFFTKSVKCTVYCNNFFSTAPAKQQSCVHKLYIIKHVKLGFFPVCSRYSIKHPACVFAERGTFLVPEMLRVVEVSAHPHWLTGVIHVPHRRGDRFVSDHPPVLTTDQSPSHVYIVPILYISQAWNSSMSSKRQFS